MAKVWDERQKRYVFDNSASTSNKTSSTTSKDQGYQGNSNSRYYPDITGKKTTQDAYTTGKGDTSYVKDAGYYREGNNWDYNADLNKNYNRAQQMKSNLEKDAVANPKLFENRADFNTYYHYNDRHSSQKQLLDEAWDNYNKVGLTSSENYRADNASKIADKKNDLKIQNAANKYSKLLPAVNAIVNKLQDRLGPVFADLQAYQAKYLNDMSELRKLQNDYYAGMKREYDALAAGQSASVGSTLSGQGLSQSAIASTVDGVDKNWQSRYNDLMGKHIETLKGLQDSESNFMNTYGNLMGSLSTIENQALQTWYNSFKDLEDHMESTYNTAADEKYAPYQTLANSYVTGQTESAQSGGKREDVDAIYKGYDTDKRAQMINGYLKTYFGEDVDISKFTPYLKEAANQNDLAAAMKYLSDATKTPTKQAGTGTPKGTAINPKDYNTFIDYQKAGGTLSEAVWKLVTKK